MSEKKAGFGDRGPKAFFAVIMLAGLILSVASTIASGFNPIVIVCDVLLLSLLFYSLVKGQKLITKLVEERVQKEILNSRQKDVEFKMLASQINPHFLYNTLETIRMKARADKEKEIEELVVMLAKIMRRNLQAGDSLVDLKSELDLTEYYLKIQSYRFGERIKYNISIETDITGIKIMPLILQPIVENAYLHGLEAKEGEGCLNILVKKDKNLLIEIKDDGTGISPEELDIINKRLSGNEVNDNGHIGLSNVNQRIKLRYGEEYGIAINSIINEGTKVTIEIPV